MTDEELIAEARRMARLMLVSVSDRDRLAAGLLKELADRLEGRPAA